MERFARVAMLRQFCSIMFPSWGSDMSFIDKTIRHSADYYKDYFDLFSFSLSAQQEPCQVVKRCGSRTYAAREPLVSS
jgi:hypothetical protein